jgi:hypothetical protein
MVELKVAQDAVEKLAAAQALVDDVGKRIVAKQTSANAKDGKADLKALASHMKASRLLMEKVVKQILDEEPVDPVDPIDPVDPERPTGSLIELTGRKATDYQLRTKVRAGKVVDTGSIKAALVSAKFGDVLMLKPGIYRGNYVLAKAGVKITHADPNRPPVMDGKIDVTVDSCAIEGLIFEGDTAIKVSLQGDRCRVAGNWIRNRTRDDAAGCIVDIGARNLIEDNLIENCVGVAIQTGTWAQKPDRNEGWYRRNVIRRMKAGQAQGSDVIAIGLNWAGQNNIAGCVVEQNIIEDCEGAGGDIIAQQSSGNIVGANLIRRSGRLRMRGGKGNVLVRNVNEDSAIAFGGQGTQAWGNRSPKIEVLAGDHAGGEAKDGTGAATNCLAVANVGTLVVGVTAARGEAVRVSGLRIEGHQGDVEGDLEGVEISDDVVVIVPQVDVPGDHSIGPDAYWLIDPEEPEEPEEPDGPDEPEEPEEPGDQVEGWDYSLDNLPGGGVRAEGRRIVKAQTFTNSSWMGQGNTDFIDCRFVGEASTSSDRIEANIRLINPTFENNQGHSVSPGGQKYVLYINMGHHERRLGFVVYGAKFKNCSGKEFLEAKGFDPKIINCDFSGAKFGNGIRIRHGLEALITGNKGLRQVTLRSHHHAVVNNPGAKVVAYSGDLPGNIEQWGPMRSRATQGKMQRAEHCYIAGVASVDLGFHYGEKQKRYPACEIVVAPGTKVNIILEQGVQTRLLKDFEAVLNLG